MSCKVSVIVPVYNCIKYLEKAVLSVIAQTEFNGVELILVDDGSSDGSEKLCDKFSSDYPNITAIHQKNSGVSVARNTGLKAAKGEYIAFLDSDDEYDPTFIREMLGAADADLVCCDFFMSDCDEKPLGNIFENRKYLSLDFDSEFCKKIINENFYSCWNKLYKTEIIKRNQLKFTPGVKYAEDMIFVFEYLKHCESFRFIDKPLYHYNINPDNVTSVVKNGFEVQQFIFNYQKEYFANLEFCDEILKSVSERFVYKTTCSINSEITYEKFSVAYGRVKSILGSEFYDLYVKENYTEFSCLYDRVFFTLLKKKKAFLVVLWRKLFDLRSKLIHER